MRKMNSVLRSVLDDLRWKQKWHKSLVARFFPVTHSLILSSVRFLCAAHHNDNQPTSVVAGYELMAFFSSLLLGINFFIFISSPWHLFCLILEDTFILSVHEHNRRAYCIRHNLILKSNIIPSVTSATQYCRLVCLVLRAAQSVKRCLYCSKVYSTQYRYQTVVFCIKSLIWAAGGALA